MTMWSLKYSCFARTRRRRKRLWTNVTQLSKNCSFYDVDIEIKSQVMATTVQGEAVAGSSVSNGDGKVHMVYAKPQTIRHVTKSNPAGGSTLGMITRQAAVMARLDSAGVATSARSLVLATIHAIVVVAQGTIRRRSSVQHGEENATNADAEIISQVYVWQQIKCVL